MEHGSTSIPRAAVFGIASGVLFMAFFGTLWAGIGTGGLQGWGEPWLSIATGVVGIALAIGGVALLCGARHLHSQVHEADARYLRHVGMWFGIIFTTEGIAIGVASVLCSATGHFDLFFPIMAIIVGVHFFPLARLFRVRAHYLTGALLCLLAISTLLLVPATITVAGHQIIAWWSVVGFGAALTLWGTGLGLWLQGMNLLDVDRNGGTGNRQE